MVSTARPELLASLEKEVNRFEKFSTILLSSLELKHFKATPEDLAKYDPKPEVTDKQREDYLTRLTDEVGKTRTFTDLLSKMNKSIGEDS